MNTFVCGANGFIGRHLCEALEAAGHRVTRGVRVPARPGDVAIDYMRDISAEVWMPRLANIDVVINAVGILCERGGMCFEAVHRDAPIALFEACMKVGVSKVAQISALGSDDDLTSAPYMLTKRAADARLMSSSLDWLVLRPSLVVGMDGDSSRFFRSMASLPVLGLPGQGKQLLQPVHIGDLCEAVVRLLASDAPMRRVLEIVGPAPITYRGMLTAYRKALRLPEPFWLHVPMPLMKFAAMTAGVLPQKVFSPDTLRMLENGNVSNAAGLEQLLGRPPKAANEWFAGVPSDMLLHQAIAAWAIPMLRIVLAFVWFATAIVSLGFFPLDDSFALLRQVGLEGRAGQAALYGAVALDGGLGLATLFMPGRRLWLLQFVLVLGYTLIISLWLPAFWLHPLGPALKNLPILALLAVLYASATT